MIELVVVLAIVTIVGCLSLGAASTSKSTSQTLQCFHNVNQMIKAWTMYAADNHDWLPANEDNGVYGNWLGGSMSGLGSYNDPTNYGLLNNTYLPAAHAGVKGAGPSAIGNYIKDSRMAKCPADPGRFDGSGSDPTGSRTNGSWGFRVRNYSMNGAVGTQSGGVTAVTGPWLNAPSGSGYGSNQPGKPYNTYGNLASWANPGPANTFVIVDEDPWSINDAGIQVDCALPEYMVDWPASFHDHGAVFSFADGHAILKHWADSRTYAIQYNHNNQANSQPKNPDIDWLRVHASGNGDGTPMAVSATPSP